MGRLLEVDYEKIFSPKTMSTLKGKSGESLRSMLCNKADERIIDCINDLLPSIERKDSPDLPFKVDIVLGENIFS